MYCLEYKNVKQKASVKQVYWLIFRARFDQSIMSVFVQMMADTRRAIVLVSDCRTIMNRLDANSMHCADTIIKTYSLISLIIHARDCDWLKILVTVSDNDPVSKGTDCLLSWSTLGLMWEGICIG